MGTVCSWRREKRVNFMAVSSANLLERNSLGGIPQCMTSAALKTILRTDSQDSQEKLRGHFLGSQCRKMEEGQILVEAADITFKEPCEGVAGGKDEIAWQHGRELLEPIFDHTVINSRDS